MRILKNKNKLHEYVSETDKKYLSVTSSGKWSCNKCIKVFHSLLDFVNHCTTQKHLDDTKKKLLEFGDCQILSLVYNEDILGFSFKVKNNIKPKYRSLNGLEQCVEGLTNDYYLVLKCKDYETIGWKLRGVEEIYEELTQEFYNSKEGKYTINVYFKPKIN